MQIWIRRFDSLTAQPLAGTDNGVLPFWSPDGKSIGFFAGGKLKKTDVSGNAMVVLAEAPFPEGGSWNVNGTIVFAPSPASPLLRVSASGGAATPVAQFDTASGDTGHLFPCFLPDGIHFLYSAFHGESEFTIRLGSLNARLEDRILLTANSQALYAQGHILFLRGGTLMARPFDAKHLAFSGDAVPVAEQVQGVVTGQSGYGAFSVSANGILTYAGSAGQLRLTWFDRAGNRHGTVGEAGLLGRIGFSPDHMKAAVTVTDSGSGNSDIWIYDVTRGLRTRFTSDPGPDGNAVWSPDGRTIVFSSNRKGLAGIYRKRADGSAPEELLYSDGLIKIPMSFSPDGSYLLYFSNGGPTARYGLFILANPLGAAASAKPVAFRQSAFDEIYPLFSPDGRWIAYMSNESGRFEINVAPFPGPGGSRQISASGGHLPRWRGDGKELFYGGPDGRLMAAAIGVKGGSVEVSNIEALFDGLIFGRGSLYDVSADGQRFLAAVPPETKADEPLTVVENWAAGLTK